MQRIGIATFEGGKKGLVMKDLNKAIGLDIALERLDKDASVGKAHICKEGFYKNIGGLLIR